MVVRYHSSLFFLTGKELLLSLMKVINILAKGVCGYEKVKLRVFLGIKLSHGKK